VYMTLPTVVVVMASFNPTPLLNFPPRGFSLAWYQHALEYADFQRAAGHGLVVTFSAGLLATATGGAAAIVLQRSNVPGRRAIEGLLLSPLIIPGVVLGLGFLILGAQLGLLASPIVLIVLHTLLVMPFVMRGVWVSLQHLDPRLERAAANLGATPAQTMIRVILPLLRPGFFAGALFSVIISLNEFAASLFVSSRTTEILPVSMFNYVRNYTDPTIAAVSTMFILATAALLLVAERLVNISSMLQIQEAR